MEKEKNFSDKKNLTVKIFTRQNLAGKNEFGRKIILAGKIIGEKNYWKEENFGEKKFCRTFPIMVEIKFWRVENVLEKIFTG